MEIATRRREQEVWQACDDLWALHGGLNELTGDAIRDRLLHLGKSRGSPNELYKYRKTWIKSRGVASNPAAVADNEFDPISRAVKLVHEQLKTEASEELLHLERDFLEKIGHKNEELAKAQRALDAVMIEFHEAQSEISKKTASLSAMEEQLAAEIEVRRAAEREVQSSKALGEQERRAHETLLKEIKEIHKEELLKHQSREAERLQHQDVLIERLMEEKNSLA